MSGFLLSIDQGTTGSTALLLSPEGKILGRANREFPQHFPRPSWVEHDLEEIWQSVGDAVEAAVAETGVRPADCLGIGITNQRETTVLWDASSGEAVGRAIVWQDRRTADRCEALKAEGFEELVAKRTGLRLDPYFSGTKLAWALENVPGARELARAGKLRFGTIDSWLVWKLTRGAVHVTDVSNASRTLLFNIHRMEWDEELLDKFQVPASVLPEVVPSSGVVGEWEGQEVRWTLEVDTALLLSFVDAPADLGVGEEVVLRVVGRSGDETVTDTKVGEKALLFGLSF